MAQAARAKPSSKGSIHIRVNRGTRTYVSWAAPEGFDIVQVHDDAPHGVLVRAIDLRRHPRTGCHMVTLEVAALPSVCSFIPDTETVEFTLPVDLRSSRGQAEKPS